jgi:small nuclear ribonucleoprotein D3
MSVHGKKGVGLPTILLHEGEAHTVTVELKNNTVYRGLMIQSEDSWNIMLKDVLVTSPEGKQSNLGVIYVRGNQIRFIILPDVLQHAPMFERVRAFKRGITMPGSTTGGVAPSGDDKNNNDGGGGGGRGGAYERWIGFLTCMRCRLPYSDQNEAAEGDYTRRAWLMRVLTDAVALAAFASP